MWKKHFESLGNLDELCNKYKYTIEELEAVLWAESLILHNRDFVCMNEFMNYGRQKQWDVPYDNTPLFWREKRIVELARLRNGHVCKSFEQYMEMYCSLEKLQRVFEKYRLTREEYQYNMWAQITRQLIKTLLNMASFEYAERYFIDLGDAVRYGDSKGWQVPMTDTCLNWREQRLEELSKQNKRSGDFEEEKFENKKIKI